jgi:hypothetical protein
MLRLTFLILLSLAFSVDEWRLADVQNLREVLGQTSSGVLSPDGSTIAWTEGNQLCLYTLVDDARDCFAPFTEDIPLSVPVWSPDSQRIAFTERLEGAENAPTSSLHLVNESDVWVFVIERQFFINFTDDGISGVWSTETDWMLNPTIGLDLAPTWNPATGELLFFSIVEQTLILYKIHDTTLEQLFVVSFDLSVSLGTSPFTRLARLSAVVSPDGSQIALTWLPAEGDWGVFLLDSANPGRWIHLVDADDLCVGLPAWSEVGMIPYHIEWAQEGLLISAYGEGFEDQESNMPAMAYFVTLPDADVMPLVDMSEVPEMMSMQHPDDTGLTPIAQLPRAAIVAPDGVTAFYLHFDWQTDYAAISAIALPPDGESVNLSEIPDFTCCFNGTALSGSNSDSNSAQMLSWGYLFTFAR